RQAAGSCGCWWRWLPRPGRAGRDPVAAGLSRHGALRRRLARLFMGAGLEGDAHVAHYLWWMRESDLPPLDARQVRAHLREAAVDQPVLDFLKPLPPGIGTLNRMLALEQRFFLADLNLTYTDKMSMTAGVEFRVPL